MHELTLWNRLGEHISWVVLGINLLHFYPLLCSNEMIMDVNVLGPLMVDVVFGQADCTQAVIEDDSLLLWKP